ncbi:MAG: SCO family protein [Planctomycetota bacterium]
MSTPTTPPEPAPASTDAVDAKPRRRWLAPAVIVALALASSGMAVAMVHAWVSAQRGQADGEPTKLMSPGPAVDFALTDQAGAPASDEDLRGKVWVADFMLTRCLGVCPVLVERMKQVQAWLDNDPGLADVRLVSFSVDGEHDTPEVLAEYARRHGVDPERWRFLTGPRRAVWALSREQLNLHVADATGPSAEREPIVHSSNLILFDRLGRLRGFYSGNTADDMDALRADIQRVVREVDSVPAGEAP